MIEFPSRFLTLDEVLRIHEDQVNRYGGSLGLRDRNLLLSALAQPEATFGGQYLHADIFEMAAAYLFHLCGNHAYIDGNKRVALVAARVFLKLNRLDLRPPDRELEELVLATARGETQKDALAAFFKLHSTAD
jgi:death-on-curing protein